MTAPKKSARERFAERQVAKKRERKRVQRAEEEQRLEAAARATKRPRPGRYVPRAAGADQAVSNARQLAFRVLEEYRRTRNFAAQILDRIASEGTVSAEDRALANEIVLGTIRRSRTIDSVLKPHSQRAQNEVEAELWTLLRVGAFQLLFLDGVPRHAAVDETIKTARWLDRERWCGFLNGVLRNLSRGLTDQWVEVPAADAVPVAPGRFRQLTAAAFPDPETSPLRYFAEAFSFPDWLADRWGAHATPEELFELGFHFNGTPRMSLRVNPLKATREDVLRDLAAANYVAMPGEHPQCIWLEGTARVADLPGFAEGRLTVQDESAMGAAMLLAPRPGDRVLDLCAAPGTKTTHLAELMHNEGEILATDVSEDRLARVAENCARLGVGIVKTKPIAADGGNLPHGPFDRVLVDVPCSNTGVIGKRPEVRWRLRPDEISELTVLQQRLLRAGLNRLKPGGRLVYSTCSIEPDEDQKVVASLVAKRPNVQILDEVWHFPGEPGDGGYQALLTVGRQEA